MKTSLLGPPLKINETPIILSIAYLVSICTINGRFTYFATWNISISNRSSRNCRIFEQFFYIVYRRHSFYSLNIFNVKRNSSLFYLANLKTIPLVNCDLYIDKYLPGYGYQQIKFPWISFSRRLRSARFSFMKNKNYLT